MSWKKLIVTITVDVKHQYNVMNYFMKNMLHVLINVELGINFDHIKDKTLQVLNPLKRADSHIMDDTDMAGPLIFCLLFGFLLLLVRVFTIRSFYVIIFLNSVCVSMGRFTLVTYMV